MAEVVINARNDAHEIELYRMFTSGTCDREAVKKEIQDLMRFGKDRLNSGKTPNLGRYDAVFSTFAAAQLYEYFISRMSANMKYQKLSDWETGKPIADFRGDRITLKALRHLDNSSANCAFDAEGAPIRDLTLIEAGVPAAWYGSRQFSWYLGLKDSFIPQNFSAEGGTSTAEELRTGNFLEVVEFSDFQVDPVSGNIAGEIRLGYLHTEQGTEIVSGGSVSGTMADLIPDMRCSIEQKQYNNCRIPSVTRLHGVTVSGAQ
jgi:PmbA protein